MCGRGNMGGAGRNEARLLGVAPVLVDTERVQEEGVPLTAARAACSGGWGSVRTCTVAD